MPPITCPDCNRDVRVEDANLRTLMAECRSCRASFRFPRPKPFVPRKRVPLPRNYRVEETEGRALVEFRWCPNDILGRAVLPFVLSFFVVHWYADTVKDGPENKFLLVLCLLLLLIPSAIAVFWVSYTLSSALNRTRILIGSGRLEVQAGPFPWWVRQSYSLDDIEQIFCESDVPLDRRWTWGSSAPFGCSVRAQLKDRSRVTLIDSRVLDEPAALALEQWIEDRIGIDDAPVRGELPRD